MEAIPKENVDIHFKYVERITEEGVVGGDDVERKVDTIIYAISFDVTYKPQFPTVGKNGVNLYNKWKDVPKSYLGLGVPDMPNFIMFVGRTWYIPAARVVTLSNLTNSLVGPWKMAVWQAPSYQSQSTQSRLLRCEKTT